MHESLEEAPEARSRATNQVKLVPDRLLRALLWLSLPVLAENVLHMLVGLTDVYLASHLPNRTIAAAATAAVGSITYVLWLIGLISGAVGTGSTAIIARAKGARHQSLANSVCGQSVTASVLIGLVFMTGVMLFARPIADLMHLSGEAHDFALYYLRILSISLPFSILMFVANACLRGAGDSVTPAIAMIVVDVVNMVVSAALTRGWAGLPVMGFRGIAIGTVVAYAAGGALQFGVLASGLGRLRLFYHRLRPHWTTLRRILRIGLPSGLEGMLSWLASFVIVILINGIDASNVLPAAHIITVRIESLSFMGGLAFATAAATMVGQSLGMNDPKRAVRSAYLALAIGGGIMTLWGLVFLLFGRQLTSVLSNDPRVVPLAAQCLFITAFAQPGFAAAMIFGGALRGAGDTLIVMFINLASILGIRLTAALAVAHWLHGGLVAIWIVLATELTIRGALIFGRFLHGGWRHAKV